MILASKYARENEIPYLGICLVMQMAIVDFARNVLNLSDANSSEFNPNSTNQVIHLMPDHPYFIGTQAHPEFKSRPNKAHPLFKGLVRAAIDRQDAQ